MRYDVAVIGAGPAGSTAARFLAKKGFKVMIMEKQYTPRDKVCGGGITINVRREFPYVENYIHKYVEKMVIQTQFYKNEVKATIGMVDRKEFDHSLLKKALRQGSDFMNNTKVTYVDDRTIKYGEVKLSPEYIIDASGINSKISRELGYPKPDALCIVGKSKDVYDGKAHIYFLDNLEGYIWIFPKRDHLHIGIGGCTKAKSLNKSLEAFLKDKKLEIQDRSAARIPYSIVDLKPYRGNVILTGDAGRFVNPVTGEGIYYAMKSGKEAAEVVAGEREKENYPSFMEELRSFQGIKDMVRSEALELLSNMKKDDKEIHDNLVDYILGVYKSPEVSERSEKTKRDKYEQVLKRL